MKKNLLLVVLSLAVCLIPSVSQAQFAFGGGIVYGTEARRAAVRAVGIYQIPENWFVEVDLNYWFLNNGTALQASLTVDYIFFTKEDKYFLYALAGGNYFPTENLSFIPNGSANKDAAKSGGGLSVGLGSYFHWAGCSLEARYEFSNPVFYQQVVVSAVFLFGLDYE